MELFSAEDIVEEMPVVDALRAFLAYLDLTDANAMDAKLHRSGRHPDDLHWSSNPKYANKAKVAGRISSTDDSALFLKLTKERDMRAKQAAARKERLDAARVDVANGLAAGTETDDTTSASRTDAALRSVFRAYGSYRRFKPQPAGALVQRAAQGSYERADRPERKDAPPTPVRETSPSASDARFENDVTERPKRPTKSAKKKTPRRRYTRFKTTTACSSWIASGGRSSSATARCWTTPRPRWTWTISSRAWTPARWDTTSVTATSAGAARRRVRNSATPNSSTPSSRFCFASAPSGGTSREDRRGPKIKAHQRPDSIPRFWRSRRPRAWTPRTPRCFAKISCLARGAGFDGAGDETSDASSAREKSGKRKKNPRRKTKRDEDLESLLGRTAMNAFRAHDTSLRRVYAHYATLEMYSASTKKITWRVVEETGATINEDEFLCFLVNFDVVPHLASRDECLAVFREIELENDGDGNDERDGVSCVLRDARSIELFGVSKRRADVA
jgi:hypothetical protein